MPKQIIWSPSAENDMEAILEFLTVNWSEGIIFRFLNKIDDCVHLISEDYKLFPLINENLQIRKCVVTKHNTIYYRRNDATIEIVRLFDNRQDPQKLKFK